MKATKFTSFCALAVLALLTQFGVPSAFAAGPYYWDNNGATAGFGTAAGTWAVPTTGSATQGWSTDVTGATLPVNVTTLIGDVVNFGTASAGLASGTITVSGTVTNGGMTFGALSGAITLSGGTSITLPAATTITLNNAADTISTPLAGAATSLTVNGGGQLILNGANTYAGGTTISTGKLTLGASGSLGSGTYAGAISIASGATLEYTNMSANQTLSGAITGQGALTADSAAARILNLTSTGNTYSGLTTLANGCRLDAASPANLSPNTTFSILGNWTGGGQLEVDAAGTVANNMTISGIGYLDAGPCNFGAIRAGGATFSGVITLGGNARFGCYGGQPGGIITGQITGGSGYYIEFCSGNGANSQTATFTLQNTGTANSYNGNTAINNIDYNGARTGCNTILKLGANEQIPNGAGNGLLAFNGADANHICIFELNGFSETVNGLSNNVAAAAIVRNTTTGTSTLTVGDGNTTSTFTGVITDGGVGSGKYLALTKIGSGKLTLTANSYNGNTTVSGGTLAIGQATLAAGSTVTVVSGAALELDFFEQANMVAALVLNGVPQPAGVYNSANSGGYITGTGSLAVGPSAWTGAFSSEWSINTLGNPKNWISNGIAADFANGNAVLFDDTLQKNSTVNVSVATVLPGDVIFNNINTNYTIQGGFGIAGTGSLTKKGAGTVTFLTPNTYSGGTTINAGKVQLGAPNVLPSGPGVGDVVLAAGTLDLNTYSATINGLSGAGTVDTVAGGTPTLTLGSNDVTSTFSGVIKNTAGALAVTKVGAGTLTLTAANTYTGATTVSAGTLQLFNPGMISSSSAGITVNSGATLLFNDNGGNWAPNNPPIILNGGTLTNYSAGNNYNVLNLNPVTVNVPSTIGVFGSGGNYNGTLFIDFGLQGSAALTIQPGTNGAGVSLRSTNSTYSGSLTVNGTASATAGTGSGLAVVGPATSLPNATITLNGTMEMGAPSTGMGNPQPAAGSGNGKTFAMDALNGAGVVVANFTAASTRTLSVGNNNGTGAFSGQIVNGVSFGTVSLVKNGAGTETLTGTNTYGGATMINAGTLALSGGALITNSASIAVANNAIFNVSGLTSPFTLAQSLSSQALGNSTPGGIISGTNNCSAGTLALVYNGVNPSLIQTNGGMTVAAGTVVTVNNTAAPLVAGTYTLIAATATGIPGKVYGMAPTSVTVAGNGATGAGSLAIDGSGNLNLVIGAPLAWSGGGSDANWTTTGNWTTGVIPGPGSNAVFNSSSSAQLATVLNANFNLGTLFLTTPSGPVSIGGANTLTVTNGINLSGASQPLTITAPVALGASQTWTVTNAQTLTVNGAVSGSSSALTVSGGGTVVLGGANTYTGATTVNAGILSLTGTNTGSSVTVANNAVINEAASGAIAGSGTTFTQNSTGTSILAGTNTYTGVTAINAGALTISGAGQLGSGTYAAAITDNGVLNYNSSASNFLSGSISGTGALNVLGSGQLVLAATAGNTYAGNTTVSNGMLIIANNSYLYNAAAPATPTTMTVGPGAQLIVATNAVNTKNGALGGGGANMTWNVYGTINVLNGCANNFAQTVNLYNGTLAGVAEQNGQSQYGPYVVSGVPTVTINANGTNTISAATMGMASGDTLALNTPLSTDALLCSGILGVPSGQVAGALVKTGLGTATLANKNVYTGGTTVKGGTLVLNGSAYANPAAILPANTSLTVSNATVSLTGYNTLYNTTAGTVTLNSGGTLVNNGASVGDNLYALVMNGGTLASGGNPDPNVGDFFIRGGITCTTNSTISAWIARYPGTVSGVDVSAGSTLNLSGMYRDGIGFNACALTKTGAGTLLLTGTNLYSSWTTISGGTLAVGGTGTLNSANYYTGTYVAAITNNAVFNWNSSSSNTLSGSIAGTGVLTNSGSGILTLSGVNTYTGATIISSNATLALAVAGAIDNSASITLAAGATLDVSAVPDYVFSPANIITASGTGTVIGTNAATIVGSAGGVVDLGVNNIILNYDGSDPALLVTNATLNLEGNLWTVNGATLANPSTNVIAHVAGGSINATGSPNLNGTAVYGLKASIVISGSDVQVVVIGTALPVTVSGLTPNSKIYDATRAATINTNGYALGGVQAGDVGNVFLVTNGYTATFANANAGTNKTVTVAGLTLGGSAASLYYVLQPITLTAAANITNASTTMTVSCANTNVYSGRPYVFLATLTSTGWAPTNELVTFWTNGVTLGTATLNPPSVAAVLATLSAGTYTLKAGYPGDANVYGSTNTVTVTLGASGSSGWVFDANPSIPGAQDGSGSWDFSTMDWWNGTADVAWTTTDAVFGGGVDGTNYTVTLPGNVSASSLTFNNSGYTLSGSQITCATVTIAAGKTATINSAVYNGNGNWNSAVWTANAGATVNIGGNLVTESPGFHGAGTFNLSGVNTTTIFDVCANVILNGGSITPRSYSFVAYSGTPGTFTITNATLEMDNGGMVVARGGSKNATVVVQNGAILNFDQGTTSSGLSFGAAEAGNQAYFDVQGGTVNMGNSSAIQANCAISLLAGGSGAGSCGIMTQEGGTIEAWGGIIFGGVSTLVYGANTTNSYTMTGGSLFLSSIGLYQGATNPSVSTVTLSGGTVGALQTWATTMPITLGTTNGNVTFECDDGYGSQHDIQLNGRVAGSGGLNKSGLGTLSLGATGGSINYSGLTVVSNGTLAVWTSANPTNGAVTVDGSAGNPTLSLAANAGQSWSIGALTFTNMNGAITEDFNFGTLVPSTSVAPIHVNGDVTFLAPFAVTVEGTSLANGTYPLIKYTGNFYGTVPTSLTLPGYITTPGNCSIVNLASSKTIALVVTSSPISPALTWAVGNGTWDINSSLNWKQAGSSVKYIDGDTVLFDDSASGSSPITVTLNTVVNPIDLTANNTLKNYTIRGNGSIAGPVALALLNSGTFTLATTNSYTGGTVVNAGQLNINNGGDASQANSAIGNGPLTLVAGAALDNTSGADVTLMPNIAETWNGNFTYLGASNSLNMGAGSVTMSTHLTLTVGANNFTVGGPISDNNNNYSLSKAGNGTLTLGNANTIGGSVTLLAGQLDLGNGGALGSSAFNIYGGAFDNVSGADMTTTPANVNWYGNFTYVGSTNNLDFGSAAINIYNNYTVNVASNTLFCEGVMSGGNSCLTKTGNGTLNLSGPGNPHMCMIVNGGTVILGKSGVALGNTSSATPGLAVNAGGTVIINSYSQQIASGSTSFPNPVTLNGGTLDLNTYSQTFDSLLMTNGATLRGSGFLSALTISSVGGNKLNLGGTNCTFDVPGTELDIKTTIAGAGSLIMTSTNGGGLLHLYNNNTYTGNTIIMGGTLQIDHPCLATNSRVSIATNAVLNLNFANGETNTVASLVIGGTNCPAGLYNIGTDPTYLAGSGNLLVVPPVVLSTNAYLTSLAFSPTLGFAPAFAPTMLTGYLETNAYASAPTVTVVNADLTAMNTLIVNGVSLGLLPSGVPSAPLTLGLGAANAVAVQVVSQDLSVTNVYVVDVTRQPSLTVPTLATSVGGNTLTMTWPADHLGYRLLVQTNHLANGVSGNLNDWGTVPGSTSVTTENITTTGTNEFYRLVYP